MSTVWTIKDSRGELLQGFAGRTPRDVGRKVLGLRHDAFRLEVSRSYRELFDRDLETVLSDRHWRIVPLPRRKVTSAVRQLELQLA